MLVKRLVVILYPQAIRAKVLTNAVFFSSPASQQISSIMKKTVIVNELHVAGSQTHFKVYSLLVVLSDRM